MATAKLEIEAWFNGLVQGVGFRYETLKIAKGYEVTGFVENLSDGRVHLLAQGTPDETRAFVAAVSENLSDYIREVEEQSRPCATPLGTFEIRR